MKSSIERLTKFIGNEGIRKIEAIDTTKIGSTKRIILTIIPLLFKATIQHHPVIFGVFITLILGLILLFLDVIYVIDRAEFLENILVEAHGLLFDVFLFGCILLWVDKWRAKKEQVARYKEELNDLKPWDEPESQYRKAGIIKRLVALKAKPDLSGHTIKNVDLKNLDLSYVNLSEGDFEGCNFEDVDFSGADLYSTNLKNIKLRGASFRSAQLQFANLDGSDITACSFDNANLTRVSLNVQKVERCSMRNSDLTSLSNWKEIESWEGTNINNLRNPPHGLLEMALQNGGIDMDYREYTKYVLAKARSLKI